MEAMLMMKRMIIQIIRLLHIKCGIIIDDYEKEKRKKGKKENIVT
jgi:hypothetical protein